MTTPTPARKAQLERGSVAWALLVALALMTLGTMFVASVIMTVQRSKASTDAVMLTQHTDTAVASAIAALNAGEPVGQAAADPLVTTDCEKVGGRSMCFRYWAMPVPGTAVDPVRYDLVTHVWIDQGAGVEPVDGRNVRAMKLPLEVITYQTTGTGMAPVNADGYVSYQPTPAGLFANAIHSFTTTTMEGPAVSVRSYNSQTGETGTRNATLSSSGWISFGAMTQVDRTVLFGGSSPTAGDHTSRCTGEGCAESGTRVVDATYATPTEASVQWMRTIAPTTCDTVWDGDWITSSHGAKLPAGETCINGSLIVDTATTMSSPLTTIFVNGLVMVSDSLNAPLSGVTATPAGLVIYSTGAVVAFDAPANVAVAAMIYAPLATCGTNPANTQRLTYFGSLVCNTVSIGGEWDHLYDDAAVADFQDPVPGAAKTFSPGVPSAVGFDEFLVPSGWVPNPCPVAPPVAATAYWKLDEQGGLLAKDSKGSGLSAGWASPAVTARVDAVCSKGAAAVPGGAIRGTQNISSVSGMTVEYWGRAVQGTAVSVGAVKITHDATRHVTVTVGTTTVKVPFTVQNPDSWHLYTVTVSTTGQVTLYVDGIMKKTVAGGVNPTAAGALTIGDGTGSLDEVVYYNVPLTATEVANRFTWWTAPPKIASSVVLTSAGDPFSAPLSVADNGSTQTLLKVRWTTPTGTFPLADPSVSYRIEQLVGATWTTKGTSAANTTSWTLANPTVGVNSYRVCALYNGDEMCSAGASIMTLAVPVAPPAPTVSNVTTTTALFSWSSVTYATRYESQYRLNGGAWSATIDHGLATSINHGPTTAGTKIEVRLRVVNAAGTGPWSAVAAAQMTLPTPAAPTVSSIAKTTVNLTWPPVNGATDYVLYVNGVAYWATASTSLAITRPLGATDTLTIRARNAYVTSASSAGTTLLMPRSDLSLDTGLNVNYTNGAVTWRNTALVSPNLRFVLWVLPDGRAYIHDYALNRARGVTNAFAGANASLFFGNDGNLVLYNSVGTWVAQTETYYTGATWVVLQDDGNLVVYTAGFVPKWALSWGTGNPGVFGSQFMTPY